MNKGRRPRCLNLNLAVSLTLQVFIISIAYKASAESMLNERLSFKDLPPEKELLIPTPTPKITASPIILSQVPRPITPIQPLPLPQPIPKEPSPEPPLNITPPTPSLPPQRPNIPGTITVKRFEFEGNTHKVFSNKKLREVTDPYTNKPITFAELLQAEAAITKLYTDAGYINSGAFIAADQVFSTQNAVVKVQIVEGGIEEIRVTGTRRLNRDYIRSRIALGTSQPLNRYRLLEALQLLQINPLIQNLSVELSAGSRPEQSILVVKVKEANSFKADFFADNARTPSVGSFRRGVDFNEGNLFGIGDSFDARYTNTDGSDALDLSYTVPVNAHNGTISLSGGFTNTQIIEPPFNRLNITGDYSYIDLSYRQPIIQTSTKELALGLTLSREESQTQLLGENFQLSAGSDNQGSTRISAARFFQDYTHRSPREVLSFHSQFSLGVGLFDATVNSKPPDSRFFSWRGQGQYVRILAPDTLLVVRSDIQATTRSLPPLEQFSLGGPLSIRGYRQDQFLTDNGFVASAEVRFPILRVEDIKGLLQIVPFVDFGVGWNTSGNADPNPNALVGMGLGLQWQMSNKFTARADYGFRLTDVTTKERTLQEQGLYFSLNYSPW